MKHLLFGSLFIFVVCLQLSAQPIQYSGNAHYYQFISAPSISWHDAKAAAEAASFLGVQGHLVTILTEDEQNFIVGTVMNGLTVRSWLGATDEASPQQWRWVTGELFWLGTANGTPQNGLYSNWSLGNPDNCCGTEHYAAIFPPSGDPYEDPNNPSPGIWVDIPDVPSSVFSIHNVGGYIIEYDTLGNNAPLITSVNAPNDVQAVGNLVFISTPFTDPDAGDQHVCSIAWGDGSPNSDFAAQLEPTGIYAGQCEAAHYYAAAGVYTVTVTVTDNNDATDTETFKYVVIYDPRAGFVTGGGWIMSPAGASPTFPAATGKANFGFVSKYQTGQTTPSGQTEFEFKAGNLNFHSDTYEWLVVAGARAQFKGVGIINGGGNYGFLLTAIDGQVNGGGGVDKFRIKIWDKSNANAIVYDNHLGAPDDADPTTALGGGSIVIHSR